MNKVNFSGDNGLSKTAAEKALKSVIDGIGGALKKGDSARLMTLDYLKEAKYEFHQW